MLVFTDGRDEIGNDSNSELRNIVYTGQVVHQIIFKLCDFCKSLRQGILYWNPLWSLNIVQISWNFVCDFVVPKQNFIQGGPKQLTGKKFLGHTQRKYNSHNIIIWLHHRFSWNCITIQSSSIRYYPILLRKGAQKGAPHDHTTEHPQSAAAASSSSERRSMDRDREQTPVSFSSSTTVGAIGQRFPNCGPRTPGGPWGSDRGSAGKWGNYCFLVEFREIMCKYFYTVTSKNLLLKSLLFLFINTSS